MQRGSALSCASRFAPLGDSANPGHPHRAVPPASGWHWVPLPTHRCRCFCAVAALHHLHSARYLTHCVGTGGAAERWRLPSSNGSATHGKRGKSFSGAASQQLCPHPSAAPTHSRLLHSGWSTLLIVFLLSAQMFHLHEPGVPDPGNLITRCTQ